MKLFDNIEQLKANLVSPLQNIEFWAMILCDKRYRCFDGAFSKSHNYNLGSINNIEEYRDFIKNIAKIFINSNPNQTDFSDKLNDNNWLDTFLKKNIHAFGKQKIFQDGKLYFGCANWFYINNYNLQHNNQCGIIQSDNIKHRLYLTFDHKTRIKFAELLVEKCNKKKYPYNFKILLSTYERQDNMQSDTVVIYLENEQQVLDYVNMIEEIMEENQTLKNHTFKPSPHLGIINSYIGYGYEPRIDGKKTSYSSFLKKRLLEQVSTIISIAEEILTIMSDSMLRDNFLLHDCNLTYREIEKCNFLSCEKYYKFKEKYMNPNAKIASNEYEEMKNEFIKIINVMALRRTNRPHGLLNEIEMLWYNLEQSIVENDKNFDVNKSLFNLNPNNDENVLSPYKK